MDKGSTKTKYVFTQMKWKKSFAAKVFLFQISSYRWYVLAEDEAGRIRESCTDDRKSKFQTDRAWSSNPGPSGSPQESL